jgi:hypothetical protein
MLAKLGMPILALAGMLSMAPKPAHSQVEFGLYFGGPAPYGYYGYPYYVYPNYHGYGYGFGYPGARFYEGPRWSVPYYGGWYGRGWYGRGWHGGWYR